MSHEECWSDWLKDEGTALQICTRLDDREPLRTDALKMGILAIVDKGAPLPSSLPPPDSRRSSTSPGYRGGGIGAVPGSVADPDRAGAGQARRWRSRASPAASRSRSMGNAIVR